MNFNIAGYAGMSIHRSIGHHPTPVQDCFDRVGVVSLTQSYCSPQMWAHYAHGYTGACVCFGVEGALRRAKPIIYRDHRSDTDFIGSLDLLREAIKEALLYKQKDWSYEREWRIVSEREKGGEYLPLGNGDVRGLVIGQKCDSGRRKALIEACKKKGIPIYTTYINGLVRSVEIVPPDFRASLDGRALGDQIAESLKRSNLRPIERLND